MLVQAVGGRPPGYAPASLIPLWAPKRLAPPSRRQRSNSFPRPTCFHAQHCSRLTRQHGGEQSGLVTLPLTFWLESGVRVTCDVGYLCANFGLPRPLCSWLRLDVRDRQTDVRQHHRLMPRLLGAGHNKVWCAYWFSVDWLRS